MVLIAVVCTLMFLEVNTELVDYGRQKLTAQIKNTLILKAHKQRDTNTSMSDSY